MWMKRGKWWVLLLSSVAVVTCSRDTLDPAGGGVESIVVTPARATVAIGATIDLSAQVLDAPVAIVASDGTVSGLLPGTATITAKAGNASGTATVVVKIGG